MSLEKLLFDSSMNTILMVGRAIDRQPDIYYDLFPLILEDKKPFSSRAARVISIYSESNPSLLEPLIEPIIDFLPDCQTNGVKQSLLRIFNWYPCPEDDVLLSKLLDICFKWLGSTKEKPAVRVYSMETIYQISGKIPELKNELILVIEEQMPYGSVGFKSRGSRILRKLYKETSVSVNR